MAQVINMQDAKNHMKYEEIKARPAVDYEAETVVDKILIALNDYRSGQARYPLSMILDAILLELCELKKS